MTQLQQDPLVIAGRSFDCRLLVGTGKFASPLLMREAVKASGAQLVTVALRRVDFAAPRETYIEDLVSDGVVIVPNTSGARNAEEAVRLARLARSSGMDPWVKLEVTPDPRSLLPDPIETWKAAEILVREGFVVLPYIPADLILAKRLEEIGCATVMPLGSPIGTGQGLRTRDAIALIADRCEVPVVVDAGLGAPSHAAEAMELGASAVLVNTAIAAADDPVRMAQAFGMATRAGRIAHLAGLAAQSSQARASSPIVGMLEP